MRTLSTPVDAEAESDFAAGDDDDGRSGHALPAAAQGRQHARQAAASVMAIFLMGDLRMGFVRAAWPRLRGLVE